MIELCCNASLAGSLGHIQQAGTVLMLPADLDQGRVAVPDSAAPQWAVLRDGQRNRCGSGQTGPRPANVPSGSRPVC